jgi:hypothetical protein
MRADAKRKNFDVIIMPDEEGAAALKAMIYYRKEGSGRDVGSIRQTEV